MYLNVLFLCCTGPSTPGPAGPAGPGGPAGSAGITGPAGPGSVAGTIVGPFTASTANGNSGIFNIAIQGGVTEIQTFVAPLAGTIIGASIAAHSPSPSALDLALTPIVKDVEQPAIGANLIPPFFNKFVPVSAAVNFAANDAIQLKWTHAGTASLQVWLRLSM